MNNSIIRDIRRLLLSLLMCCGIITSYGATVVDLVTIEYNYVLVCEESTSSGTERPGKGTLFGDGHFLDVTGGSYNKTKGQVDLSVVDSLGDGGTPLYVTEDIVSKYGSYGSHYNSLRLKNAQDMIALKVVANTKLIFFLQGNNQSGASARIPQIA